MTTWPEDYRSGVADSIARARADLAAALDGVELDDQEQRVVAWLSGWDQPTLHTVAGIIRKARSAGQTDQRYSAELLTSTGVLPP